MKATVIALALAAALISVGCGEGRAIFNVDVYSFIQGTGNDTVPYLVPAGISDTASNTPQEISLPPGFGSSAVDSVRFVGNVNLVNVTGAGTIGFRLYIDTTSGGTLNASALAINIPPTSVGPGADTVAVPISQDLTTTLKDVFSSSSIWIRIEAIGANPGATALTGNMVLTALQVRIVLQDKIF